MSGDAPEPTTAEVRAWARSAGLVVPDRGRLRPEVWESFRAAHQGPPPCRCADSTT
ncbi:Lsr2 dimerization domain-containing protein [Actinomycetospora atypica]|uniref:Histone-like nucleoid-structuring protein Lsr2 n=1 Tax=Actinomycetospora atypica TaxID=1290095 RepID=A0ABV9YQP9_9PSEU